jgi:hypothetical protein
MMQTPEPQQRLSELKLDSLSRITFGRYKKSKYSIVKMLILFYLVTLDEVNLLDKGSWFFDDKSRK